jgi:hypothetical protein
MALITDPTSPLYNTPAGGLQPTATPNPTLKAGQYYNTFNQIVTPGVPTPAPSGTAVITSKPAINDINNIKTQADQMQQGITQQSQNNALASANQITPPETATMSFTDKANKALQYGIQNYTGTREQDLVLLTKMAEEKATLQEKLKNMPEGSGYLAEGEGGQTQTNTNLSAYQQAQNDRNNEIDQQIKTVLTTTDQFLKGTLPLTPDQIIQVESMKQKAESIRQAQLLANRQFEGVIAKAGRRSGRNIYTPEMFAGEIASAVNTGLSKLQDLDTQAADNLAKLQQGFRESNYKLIKESWDEIGKLKAEKAKTIKDTYDAVASAEKEQTRILEKQKDDYYNQVTKPIQEIGLEAAKNAASPEVQAKIRSAKTVQEAITAAGSSLMSATGDVGEYLGYMRMSEAQGLTPRTFDEWTRYKDQQEASKAYASAYSAAKGRLDAEKKYGDGVVPTVKQINGVDMMWDTALGKWKPIDSSGVQNETSQKILDQLTFLKSTATKAKQLAGAAGRSGARRAAEAWFVGSTDYSQLEALTNTLKTNILTLATDPNIKKFFGPQMSNADVLLMTSAGTTLNPETNNPDMMVNEIGRLENLFNKMQSSISAKAGDIDSDISNRLVIEDKQTVDRIASFVSESDDNKKRYNELRAIAPNATPDELWKLLTE